jgi:hypothetical protein
MTYEEILEAFSIAESVPEEALREAMGRREELSPLFLAEVERWIVEEAEDPEIPAPIYYLFHLFGSWREPKAYRLFSRVLRLPSERLDWQFGDDFPTTGPRVMATLCDGDLQPIRDIIEDEAADEWMRGFMFPTLGVLFLQGRIPRAELVAYMRDCRSRLTAPPESVVWGEWACLVADLGLTELRDTAEEIFAAGLVDETCIGIAEVRRDLANPKRVSWSFEPFGEDVVEELVKVFGRESRTEDLEPMTDDDRRTIDEMVARMAARGLAATPVTNPNRRVGRNDPCPCGSGRKFKRCCGA